MAHVWNDKKRKMFTSSTGTTELGTPHKRRRYNIVNGAVVGQIDRLIQRSCVAGEYFDGAHKIDVRNHIRQGSLDIEHALRTKRWDIRVFLTLLGMIEVDAYLAYKFSGGQLGHSDVTYQVV